MMNILLLCEVLGNLSNLRPEPHWNKFKETTRGSSFGCVNTVCGSSFGYVKTCDFKVWVLVLRILKCLVYSAPKPIKSQL